MKSKVIVGLCCWLSIITVRTLWAGPAMEKSSVDAPRVSIKESRFQFDPVLEGTIVEHAFKIANTGKAPLTIDNVRTNCGCTIADFTRTIPPGGVGHVVIKGNTEGYGGEAFSKTIIIFCNDLQGPRPKLSINGRVRRFAGIEPAKAVLRGTVGKPTEVKVRITLEPDFPFRVVASYADERLENNIAFTLQEQGNHYVLTVKNKMKTQGRYWGVIHLKTDNPEKRELLIRVMGDISESVS